MSDSGATGKADRSYRRALTGPSTPDNIGTAVAFLPSDDAHFITGVILPVDGGITPGGGQPRC